MHGQAHALCREAIICTCSRPGNHYRTGAVEFERDVLLKQPSSRDRSCRRGGALMRGGGLILVARALRGAMAATAGQGSAPIPAARSNPHAIGPGAPSRCAELSSAPAELLPLKWPSTPPRGQARLCRSTSQTAGRPKCSNNRSNPGSGRQKNCLPVFAAGQNSPRDRLRPTTNALIATQRARRPKHQ